MISASGRVVISVLVNLGFFWALYMVITTKVQGNATPEILLLMLGALTSKWGDTVVYWIGSSAGSSDKDANQASQTQQLIQAVSTSSPAQPAALPWWGRLTDDEKAAIATAGAMDARVKAFADSASAGTATMDDLAYVVSLGLITQDRAAAISSVR